MCACNQVSPVEHNKDIANRTILKYIEISHSPIH